MYEIVDTLKDRDGVTIRGYGSRAEDLTYRIVEKIFKELDSTTKETK